MEWDGINDALKVEKLLKVGLPTDPGIALVAGVLMKCQQKSQPPGSEAAGLISAPSAQSQAVSSLPPAEHQRGTARSATATSPPAWAHGAWSTQPRGRAAVPGTASLLVQALG